jgi:hypothetical protein
MDTADSWISPPRWWVASGVIAGALDIWIVLTALWCVA